MFLHRLAFEIKSLIDCLSFADGLMDDIEVANIELGRKVENLKQKLLNYVFDGYAAGEHADWQPKLADVFKKAANNIEAEQNTISTSPELASLAANAVKQLKDESKKINNGKCTLDDARQFAAVLYYEFNEALSKLFADKNKH